MARNHRDEATVALIDRDVERAADTYTRAAYGTLAGFENEGEDRDPLGPNARWAGYGLSYLLLAGACYRAVGKADRAAARCREGIAIARDLRAAVLSGPLDRACCGEFVGDFETVGNIDTDGGSSGADDGGNGNDDGNASGNDADGDEDGYDRAIAAYASSEIDDPMSWATSPMAEAARRGPQQLARNTPHSFNWDELHGSDPDSASYLVHRPRFKRSRLPAAVSHVADVGYVHPPRGSTEHNNATWRCPECDRSEVNWIAGETICLDCSVRMEEK